MPQKFWMVWVHDTPTTKHRHPTLQIALQEADRLARLPENIGKKVYVLEALDYRYVEPTPLKRIFLGDRIVLGICRN